MKNALPILIAVVLLLLPYIGSYFWSVRPVAVVWLPGKHVPAYHCGQWSKPFFGPLLWLDTQFRPDYW